MIQNSSDPKLFARSPDLPMLTTALYGLARDGRTNSKGLATNVLELALL
jgi:hypothetical protein